jgi:hypothetical protein
LGENIPAPVSYIRNNQRGDSARDTCPPDIFLSSPMDVLKGTDGKEEFDAYGYSVV